MRKVDVLLFFEGNQSAVARALRITRASVNGWPEVVPLEPARALEILSREKLSVDESLYPRLKLAHEFIAEQHRSELL